MNFEDIMSRVVGEIENSGLGNFPGKLLYSAPKTLLGSDLYFIGYNPGGNPNEERNSIRAETEKFVSDPNLEFNEFLDARWVSHGKIRPAGQHFHQRRVQYLFEQVRLSPRTVLASNLVWIRTNDVDAFRANFPADQIVDRCWGFHQQVIESAGVKVIIANGVDDTANALRRKLPMILRETCPSGHGNVHGMYFEVRNYSKLSAVIAVPHLSRYKIQDNPKFMKWVKDKFDQSICI